MASKETSHLVKKANKEMITSHKVSITVLIRNYCLYRDSGNFSHEVKLVINELSF